MSSTAPVTVPFNSGAPVSGSIDDGAIERLEEPFSLKIHRVCRNCGAELVLRPISHADTVFHTLIAEPARISGVHQGPRSRFEFCYRPALSTITNTGSNECTAMTQP